MTKWLAELEQKTDVLAAKQDGFSCNTRVQLQQVFDALRELMTPPETPKRLIGFAHPGHEAQRQALRVNGTTPAGQGGGWNSSSELGSDGAMQDLPLACAPPFSRRGQGVRWMERRGHDGAVADLTSDLRNQ
ncbi:MAG: hypothetical protein ACT4NL_02200 [Pseudomarimonas sp.]